jgi:UDP-N-acetylglucosamine 2-epimerase
MTVLTVVGARPQFIKAAPLSRALRRRCREVLLHTGQHFDHGMSNVFFEELQIPAPDHHLGIGGGSHGAQTGAMLAAIEAVLIDLRPDLVLVYGDTNSTLAGALAAVKLRIPVAHVEAGLRSFNRAMPEEINRVLTDHASTFLFAPSEVARQQLAREGIADGVHVVGDIMYDAVLMHRESAAVRPVLQQLNLTAGEYYLCTLHRAENVDNRERLAALLGGLARLDRPAVVPMHPRTRRRLQEFGLEPGPTLRAIDPVGYLDMLALTMNGAAVLTDSGGLQKEAYYMAVPCVTLRSETEWVETVSAGWNVLAGDPAALAEAVERVTAGRPSDRPQLYGDGQTAARIAAALVDTPRERS